MTGHRHTRILLSGGIGAGKSAAARIIEARGYPVIHADKIGHAVLEPEGEAFDAVAERWPEAVVDGTIDRPRLAAIVFEDAAALAELESLTHPAIAARIMNLVERESDSPLVAVELPVLLPILGDDWTRVVVDAPLDVRRQRLRDRGMEQRDIEARLAAQPSSEQWRAAADHIVDNTGSLDQLESEIDRLLSTLLAVS